MFYLTVMPNLAFSSKYTNHLHHAAQTVKLNKTSTIFNQISLNSVNRPIWHIIIIASHYSEPYLNDGKSSKFQPYWTYYYKTQEALM